METDIKYKVETPDVIIIDCDDERTIPDKNSSSKLHKKKRKVTITKVDNLESVLITQNVHVKRQKITCVINLETDVSDSKRKRVEKNGLNNKLHRSNVHTVERILPRCSRSICESKISDFLCNKRMSYKHKLQSTRTHQCHKKKSEKSKKCSSNKCYKQKHCKKLQKNEAKKVVEDPSNSLSSISLSPFLSDLTYEDISQDSFSSYSDDELDTLIRRAKERERRMCTTPKLCIEKPLHSSTPQNIIEVSTDEESLKLDESIHSLETFILESQSDMAYSPIVNTSNITTRCKKENNVFIQNSVPTIDLTDNNFDSVLYETWKPSKYVNNSIKIQTDIPNLTDENMLRVLKQPNIVYQRQCEKNEPNKCFKSLAKSFEPIGCKPNVAKLDMLANNVKLPLYTEYSPKFNSTEKLKTKK